MKSFSSTVILACTASAALAQQLMVNSLNDVVVCEPVQITWQGGQPPYYLSLIPAGQPAAAPIKQFPIQNGNSLTWVCDIGVGVGFTTALKDGVGELAYSGEQTVMNGTDASCVNDSVSETASSTAASSPASMASTSASLTSGGAAFANPTSASSSSSGSASHSSNAATSHTSSSATPSPTQLTKSSAAHSYTVGLVGVTALLGFIGFMFI